MNGTVLNASNHNDLGRVRLRVGRVHVDLRVAVREEYATPNQFLRMYKIHTTHSPPNTSQQLLQTQPVLIRLGTFPRPTVQCRTEDRRSRVVLALRTSPLSFNLASFYSPNRTNQRTNGAFVYQKLSAPNRALMLEIR